MPTRVGLLMVLHLITCSHCSLLYPTLRYNPLPVSGKEMSFQLFRRGSPAQNHNLSMEEEEEGILRDSAEKRTQRHADAIFTNSYRKVLGQISARKFLQTIMGKRLGQGNRGEEDHEVLSRRQLDSILMDSCYHKQMVLQDFLTAMLRKQRPKRFPRKLKNSPGILTRLINL
ncbi:somatoliberin [Monodelphis domestica]|uniref:somatoliberin n=1 Tax=Monodelphis domestica TaxID=13616 RepID=UPI0024E23F14|nr:somatoliberin [Monodelphis domestica]XP_056667900.1 somatoliberin [Monodelphis domestica]